MDNVKCKNCKWWEYVQNKEPDYVGIGICRRNAPMPVLVREDVEDNLVVHLPRMDGEHDWCGSFVFMKKKPKTI